ncbi:unnamed protein product [Closterium sp. Naga37s-1]|nr:unnamed protein product [Closterium sp. Naga37s-1]
MRLEQLRLQLNSKKSLLAHANAVLAMRRAALAHGGAARAGGAALGGVSVAAPLSPPPLFPSSTTAGHAESSIGARRSSKGGWSSLRRSVGGSSSIPPSPFSLLYHSWPCGEQHWRTEEQHGRLAMRRAALAHGGAARAGGAALGGVSVAAPLSPPPLFPSSTTVGHAESSIGARRSSTGGWSSLRRSVGGSSSIPPSPFSLLYHSWPCGEQHWRTEEQQGRLAMRRAALAHGGAARAGGAALGGVSVAAPLSPPPLFPSSTTAGHAESSISARRNSKGGRSRHRSVDSKWYCLIRLLELLSKYLSFPLLHVAAFAASSSKVWHRQSYWTLTPPSNPRDVISFSLTPSHSHSQSPSSLDSSSHSPSSPPFSSNLPSSPSASTHSSASTLPGSFLSSSFACNSLFGSWAGIPPSPLQDEAGNPINFSHASAANQQLPPGEIKQFRRGLRLLRRSAACLAAAQAGRFGITKPGDEARGGGGAELDEFAELAMMMSAATRDTRLPFLR